MRLSSLYLTAASRDPENCKLYPQIHEQTKCFCFKPLCWGGLLRSNSYLEQDGCYRYFSFYSEELSHRKVKCLAQGHTDNSRQIQDTNPSQLAPAQIR